MRTVYRVLAYLIALEVLLQAAMIAFAVFGLRHWIDEGGVLDGPTVQNHAEGFGEVVGFQLHAMNGQMIVPVIAVLLLVSSFFAKVSRAEVWALIVLLSVVVQVLLGLFAVGAPALGILHGINGVLLFAVAVVAARRADVSGAGSLPASRLRRSSLLPSSYSVMDMGSPSTREGVTNPYRVSGTSGNERE